MSELFRCWIYENRKADFRIFCFKCFISFNWLREIKQEDIWWSFWKYLTKLGTENITISLSISSVQRLDSLTCPIFDNFDADNIDDEKFKVLVDEKILKMDLSGLKFVRDKYKRHIYRFIKRNLDDYLELQSELFHHHEAKQITSHHSAINGFIRQGNYGEVKWSDYGIKEWYCIIRRKRKTFCHGHTKNIRCIYRLTHQFIWGQDKDKTLMILKEKEKAGALPAGRRGNVFETEGKMGSVFLGTFWWSGGWKECTSGKNAKFRKSE